MRFMTRAGMLCLMFFYLTIQVKAGANFPALTGRVVDNANLLNSTETQLITNTLKEHEDNTTNQVVVVTLPSLEGYTIEEYGYQLGRHWAIGQAGKNNGVLLIVAPTERKVRIEVGYGLESVLTDAVSSIIIQRFIVPSFKKGKMNEGILIGSLAIVNALDGDPMPTAVETTSTSYVEDNSHESDSEINPVILVASILTPMLAFFVFIIYMGIRHSKPRKSRRTSSYNDDDDDSNWSTSWSSSDNSFSGGGGSFGGGGASGDW